MTTFAYDAFISFPETEVLRVEPLVKAFEATGLKIFWSRHLLPGQIWAEVLEQRIAESRHTIVLVCPASLRSKYMWAEIMRSAKSPGKIVPVFIEPTELNLNWEAHIDPIQRATLDLSRLTPGDPVFTLLCEIIAGRKLLQEQAVQTLEDRAHHLIKSSTIPDLSLVIALAVLGGAPADDISLFATDFERRYRAMDNAPATSSSGLESLTGRFARLQAETFTRTNRRFNVMVNCARFKEPALGHTVLALAWSEYEKLRAPILSWIEEWAADSPLWIRLRLALNIGILAQDAQRFESIYRLILRPMLFENLRRRGRAANERFDVADAALSIVALDPSRASTVAVLLEEMIAAQKEQKGLFAPPIPGTGIDATGPKPAGNTNGQNAVPANASATQPAAPSTNASGATEPTSSHADADDTRDDLAGGGSESSRLYLAARLAFGYTGARYPDLAVKTLRTLVDLGKFPTLGRILGDYFKEKMSKSKADTDGSLWDPIAILDGLLGWSNEVPSREQDVPLTIFALGLADLPLASEDGDQLSLTSIMRRRGGIAVLREGFLRGLARADTNDQFEEILRDWRDRQRKEPVDPDPVLALACALFFGATAERDRSRVKFVFRGHYDEAALQLMAQQAPELVRKPRDEH